MTRKNVSAQALKAADVTRLIPSTKIRALVSALLNWFARDARDLPWRRTSDPYAIWVSEIMLQQTQVKTVIPYWERWMRALPTIQSLADADAQTIHKLWEGLGYYTRVRNLQRAAREIVSRHQGQFPQTHEVILELPGIGPYTAGAISSIAFNQPQPILDGNVIRVLTRLFGIEENPREKFTNKRLWSIAQQFVNAAGHFSQVRETRDAARGAQITLEYSALNQSLMELGALICTPKKPQCPRCPWRSHCVARRLERVEDFPNLGPRVAATEVRRLVFVIQHRDKFFVRVGNVGRASEIMRAFEDVLFEENGPDAEGLARKHLGLRVMQLTHFMTFKHTVTRYRITLEVWRGRIKRIPRTFSQGEWLTLEEMDLLPFASAHRKILGKLLLERGDWLTLQGGGNTVLP